MIHDSDGLLIAGINHYFGLKGARYEQSSPGMRAHIILVLYRQGGVPMHVSQLSRLVGCSTRSDAIRVHIHYIRKALGGMHTIERIGGEYIRMTSAGFEEMHECFTDMKQRLDEALARATKNANDAFARKLTVVS